MGNDSLMMSYFKSFMYKFILGKPPKDINYKSYYTNSHTIYIYVLNITLRFAFQINRVNRFVDLFQ